MAKQAFKKNGVVIGCRDVVFCKITEENETATTYDEDIQGAPGVIEIALTSQSTNESLGADDVALYEVLNSLDGFEVNVTLASLSPEAQSYLLGNTVDSAGVLIEKSDDAAPYVAMGFKTARTDGSDDYIWLYRGKFAQSDATFRTKEQGTVNWQTPVITGTFTPRLNDKRIRARVNTKDEKATAIVATFFDKVYEQSDP